MKKLFSILLLVAVATFVQCGGSGDDDDPTPDPGDLTASAFSPEVIYSDDEVTITGTGFSTTKDDNVVKLGVYGSNIFTEVTGSGGQKYHVVSATATKLVVAVEDPEYLNLLVQEYYDYAFKIIVGDNEVIVPIGKIRKLINFHVQGSEALDRVPGCLLYFQAGDSILMTGLGFYGNCSMTIANKNVEIAKVGDQNNKVTFRIPKDHFGALEDDCLEEEVPVKITNGDGKSFTRMTHLGKSPPMRVYEMSFDKPTYPEGTDHAILTISGYSIYGGTRLRLSSPNGYESEGGVSAAGYPNEVEVIFTIKGLDPGQYNLQYKERESDEYGLVFASFVIN